MILYKESFLVPNIFVKVTFSRACSWLPWSSGLWGEKMPWNPCVSTGSLVPFAESAFPGLVLHLNHWSKWPSALAEWHSGPVSGAHCPNSQTPISEFLKHVMAFSFWSSASMHPMTPQQLSIPSVGFRCLRPLHVIYMQGEPRVLLFWALPVSISTHQAHSRLDGNLTQRLGCS